MKRMPKIRSSLDEKGGATAEFALWIPVLVLILALMVEATSAFARQTHMWRIASDIGRGLSTGRIKTGDVDALAAALASDGVTYTIPEPSLNGNLVTTVVLYQLPSGSALGVLSQIFELELAASVTMELQPHVQSIH